MPFPESLVSVIIPCYNQAYFLGEAIESVLAQTYPNFEIILVDDGSTDNTAAVTARYPVVRYVRQENQGTAAARNRGFQESAGSYLVFLDADDRLLPEAFETGLNCLNAHPECGLVFGLCKFIAHDGSFLLTPQPPPRQGVDYVAMLRRCLINHPAQVLCRRAVFDSTIAFDTSLVVCSDYDFYLRVARSWPIYCHHSVVSEYRQHSANRSLDNAKMLKYTLSLLRSQWPFVAGNRRYEKAYRAGIRKARRYYYRLAVQQAIRNILSVFKFHLQKVVSVLL